MKNKVFRDDVYHFSSSQYYTLLDCALWRGLYVYFRTTRGEEGLAATTATATAPEVDSETDAATGIACPAEDSEADSLRRVADTLEGDFAEGYSSDGDLPPSPPLSSSPMILW